VCRLTTSASAIVALDAPDASRRSTSASLGDTPRRRAPSGESPLAAWRITSDGPVIGVLGTNLMLSRTPRRCTTSGSGGTLGSTSKRRRCAPTQASRSSGMGGAVCVARSSVVAR